MSTSNDEPQTVTGDVRAWMKLAMLSEGIAISKDFAAWFAKTEGLVKRRNFYNSPGISSGLTAVPQEIRLSGGEVPVTVAVNNYGRRTFELTLDAYRKPVVTSETHGLRLPIELPADLATVVSDANIARVCNLYGGSALSFFTPRGCYFFADGTECRFCSLAGTARESADYASHLRPKEVHASITSVLSVDAEMLNQIMIVGGNERDLDQGFLRQVRLVRSAAQALYDQGVHDHISVHLIVMPPQDLSLISELSGIPNLHVGFNLEVWDPGRFSEIAPGKAADYGQVKLRAALDLLRDAVGAYRAHSILIAGLEPIDSTIAGANSLAADGISPIINAYHSDRHSNLGLTLRPSYDHLAYVAAGLQSIHDLYPIQAYWEGCGRNAIDFEAANGLFRAPAPGLELLRHDR
jgi:hypothetical protein